MTKPRFTLGYLVLVTAAFYWAYTFVASSLVSASIRTEVHAKAAAMTQEASRSLEAGRHAVATGSNRAEVQRAHDDLARKVALPGEAARANTALNVMLVGLTPAGDTFTALDLDIAGVSRAGLLLVTDQPVEWRIQGATTSHRSKIAIGARAPVLAPGMRQGVLAGLRVQGFGVRDTIGATSVETERSRFCTSMASWQQFFGLQASVIDVWSVDAAAGAILTAHDGGMGGAAHIGTVKELCN